MPKPGSEAEYQAHKDPRLWLQQIHRASSRSNNLFSPKLPRRRPKSVLKNDWAESIGAGGRIVDSQFPAKFSFNTNSSVTSANCSTDYVIYNTGISGSQASIIAFNNLYPGICTIGTVPGVAWAYTTTAPVFASVTLSLDGKQIAFVTSGSPANLVLLKLPTANATTRTFSTGVVTNGTKTVTDTSANFAQTDVGAQVSGTNIPSGDTIAAVVSSTQITLATNASGSNANGNLTITAESLTTPGVAPNVTHANYAACTAPCTTTFSLGASDNTTAPYYDFGSDSLFVGTDTGVLIKFNPVFNGTPVLVATLPLSASGERLTSPVYDAINGLVLVADAHASGNSNDGRLYTVDSAFTTVDNSAQVCLGGGYVDAPLVDPVAGRAYIACGNDQGGGACATSSSCMRQFNYVSGLTGSAGTGVQIGTSTANVAIYSGAFDNNYLTSANGSSPTGNVYICGNAGGPATIFAVPITSNAMGSAVASRAVSSATDSTQTICGPVTEFFNSTTGVDWLFVGEKLAGNATGCSNAGCVYSFSVTSALSAGANATAGFASNGGSSGIIVDNIGTDTAINQIANIYFTALSNSTGGNKCNGTSGVGCAFQVRQDIL